MKDIVDAASIGRVKTGYRPDIDGMRAIAVVVVVLFHLGTTGFGGGFIGVDVFFVISGFLITGLIRNEVDSTNTFRFGHFYLRRVRRLFPALALTLAASLVAAILLFPPEPLQRFAGSFITSIFSVSNIWFWQEAGYFDAAAITKPLLHTWTLSVEEQFYFIWPALLFLLMRISKRSAPIWGLVIVGLLSLLWNFDLAYFNSTVTRTLAPPLASWMENEHASIFYLTMFRMFEFAIGALLNWSPSGMLRKGWAAEIAAAAGLVMILAPVGLYSSTDVFPAWRALAPCIGAALLIQSAQTARTTSWMRTAPVVWVGRISYSLYLVHWPLIVFYLYWRNQAQATLLEQAALFAVAVAISALMYQFVEQPLRKPGTTKAANRRFLGGSAILASVFVGLGAMIYFTGGATWRYSAEEMELLETAATGDDHACFMNLPHTREDIDPACYQIDPTSRKKSILLFGDSTAEHLVSGFREVFSGRYQVLQFASASCPPMLNYSEHDTPNCPANVEAFLTDIIANNQYDLVVISSTSRWFPLATGFAETARRLDAAGIPYVMLGQIPYFDQPPADIIARLPEGAGIKEALRSRVEIGCDGSERGVDKLVPEERFFSMEKFICDGGYPRYELDGQLIHKDHIHFNARGSELAARAIEAWLVETGNLP
ncbi:acyltransferase family protein [Henriciella marina]|uniref:acyltransferase family protein n=1 Tax=Henriciella marina TaxID=453851 RepID=UPI000376B170|nr:acyltransferase family protein [Henriciella marina]